MGTPLSKPSSTRRGLLACASASAIAAVMLAPYPARGQAAPPPLDLPSGVAETETTTVSAGHVFYFQGEISEDYQVGHVGGGFTLADDGRNAVSLWADAFAATVNEALGQDYDAASLGLAWRRRTSETTSWGVNSFVDVGRTDDSDETLAQVSLGADILKELQGAAAPSLQLGGNFYVPLEDYSDVEAFGVLDAAPQFGADAFARYERDVVAEAPLRLNVTAGVFEFPSGSDSENLWGGFSSAGLTYAPESWRGFAASAEVGVRYASGGDGPFNEDARTTPFLGLELSYSWGGRRTTTRRTITEATAYDPPRDCAIARDGEGQAYYDCARPVIVGDATAASKEGVVRESLPLPPPRIEERTEVAAGGRPLRPLRHMGFDSPLAPIRREEGFTPSPLPPPPPPPPPSNVSPPPPPPPPPAGEPVPEQPAPPTEAPAPEQPSPPPAGEPEPEQPPPPPAEEPEPEQPPPPPAEGPEPEQPPPPPPAEEPEPEQPPPPPAEEPEPEQPPPPPAEEPEPEQPPPPPAEEPEPEQPPPPPAEEPEPEQPPPPPPEEPEPEQPPPPPAEEPEPEQPPPPPPEEPEPEQPPPPPAEEPEPEQPPPPPAEEPEPEQPPPPPAEEPEPEQPPPPTGEPEPEEPPPPAHDPDCKEPGHGHGHDDGDDDDDDDHSGWPKDHDHDDEWHDGGWWDDEDGGGHDGGHHDSDDHEDEDDSDEDDWDGKPGHDEDWDDHAHDEDEEDDEGKDKDHKDDDDDDDRGGWWWWHDGD